MSAISIRQLGKRFTLGRRSHTTLRDHLAACFRREKKTTSREMWALRDVSFDALEGEVVGIVGRNGAGKSTLLKILSQITEPTEGEVRIRGRIASLLEVGTGFHSELTGRENVYLNGAILGMRRAEINRKFDEIVAFSEVEKFLDTPVKHYSSGMSMRLAFAVAAHLEPEILLVDEVLAVGDAAFQQKCMGKMDEVASAGRTILFVSHSMAAMTALCSKGIFLENGRLKGAGTMGEIVNLYMGETASSSRQNAFCTDQRSGNGRVLITNLELECNGIPNTAVVGGKTTLTITYESDKENLPTQFMIAVYDAFNNRVLAMDSKVVNDLPHMLPARGRILIEFPESFSLSPGRYNLNVAACLYKETADLVQQALSFNVEDGDFFGTGRLPYAKAIVLCRNRWTLLS